MACSNIHKDLLGLAVDIDSVRLDPRNARKHGVKNLDAIKHSLSEFQQCKPIIATSAGVIIAGNGTHAAAKALGWDQIAVLYFANEKKARAFALADNRTAELAEWDMEILRDEVADLRAMDFDLAELGFDDDDLRKLDGDPGNTEPPPPGPQTGGYDSQWGVIVICGGEAEQQRVFEQLQAMGMKCRVVVT